jgi:hypothetical protein
MYRHTNAYKAPANYNEIRDIWLACKLGLIRDVQYLLSRDPALLHTPNDHNNTPLYIAAHAGHYELTQYLCEKGARDDKFRRAYLSALNLPIRHLILRYNPQTHNNETKVAQKQEQEQEQDNHKSNSHLVDYFVEMKAKTKLDDGMKMGGVLFFKATPEKRESKMYRCHLSFLLARFCRFATVYLGKDNDEIVTRIREIQNANDNDFETETRDIIELGDIDPVHFKILAEYVYTGGLFAKETQLKSFLENGTYITKQEQFVNFQKFYMLCVQVGADEIISILDAYLALTDIDISLTIEQLLQERRDAQQEVKDYAKELHAYFSSCMEQELERLTAGKKISKFQTKLETEFESICEKEKNLVNEMKEVKKGKLYQQLEKELKLLRERKHTCHSQIANEKGFHYNAALGPAKVACRYAWNEYVKEFPETARPPIPEYEKAKNAKFQAQTVVELVEEQRPIFSEEMKRQKLKEEQQRFASIMAKQVREQLAKELRSSFKVMNMDDEEEQVDQVLRRNAILATHDIHLVALPFGEEETVEYVEDGVKEILTPITPVNHAFIPSTIISCHRDFIAWKSEYFKVAMMGSFSEAEELRSEMAKGDNSPVQFKIYNCTDAALVELVCYTYTEQCTLTCEIAIELLFLAMRCDIGPLIKLAKTYICAHAYEFDAIEILMISDLVNSPEMRTEALSSLRRRCADEYRTGKSAQSIRDYLMDQEIPLEDVTLVTRSLY